MALTADQIKGLDVASQKKAAGTANSEDLKNLDFAAKQGYRYTAPAPTPSYQRAPYQEPPAYPIGSAQNPSRYTAPTSDTYDTEAGKLMKEAAAPVDEAAIRKEKADAAQAQIDAINARFDSVITQDKIKGTDYMGQTRAAASRGGTLGSDFGTTNLAKTDQMNKDVIAADEAKRSNELAAVWANVDQRATDEINRKTEMALKGRDTYIAWLKDNRDSARTDFAALAKTGKIKSLSELSEDDYNKLLNQTGYDEAMAKLIFNANLPAAKKIEYQYKVDGNKLVAYGVDPVTNQVSVIEKQLQDNVPADYKPTVLPDGTLIFSPSKIDPSKPLKDQVIMYGAEGEFAKPVAAKKGTGSGTTDTEQSDRDAVAADISAITGSDGKLDTAKYQQIRQGISVNSPKLLTWFDKTYDPKVVLNPDDPTNPYATKKTAAKTNQELLKENKDKGMTEAEAKTNGFTDADIQAVYGSGSSDKSWWQFWK